LRSLDHDGQVAEQDLIDPDGTHFVTGQLRVSPELRLIDEHGRAHPRRFGLGPHTTSRAPAFARPRTNALSLRHNDLVAQRVLDVVAAPALAEPLSLDRR
jgi:hypothetical protein